MLNGETILLSVEGVHLRGLKKQSHYIENCITNVRSVVIPDLIRNPEFSMKHLDSRFCGNGENSTK